MLLTAPPRWTRQWKETSPTSRMKMLKRQHHRKKSAIQKGGRLRKRDNTKGLRSSGSVKVCLPPRAAIFRPSIHPPNNSRASNTTQQRMLHLPPVRAALLCLTHTILAQQRIIELTSSLLRVRCCASAGCAHNCFICVFFSPPNHAMTQQRMLRVNHHMQTMTRKTRQRSNGSGQSVKRSSTRRRESSVCVTVCLPPSAATFRP